MFIEAQACEDHNQILQDKVQAMENQEVRWEEQETADCELLIAAYGTPSRIAMTAVSQLREKGIKAGLFRPITLWPFPYQALGHLARQDRVKAVLTVEMSLGQMVDDVRLAVGDAKPVSFFGRAGGSIPTVAQIVEAAEAAWKGGK